MPRPTSRCVRLRHSPGGADAAPYPRPLPRDWRRRVHGDVLRATSRAACDERFDCWGRFKSASIMVDTSGKATLHDLATVPAQIAADSLEIPFDDLAGVPGVTRQVQAEHRATPPALLDPIGPRSSGRRRRGVLSACHDLT